MTAIMRWLGRTAALREVDPGAIDPETRGVLEATAGGALPKIWG